MLASRQYFRFVLHPHNSLAAHLWWCIANPFNSAIGRFRIAGWAATAWQDLWREDFAGKRVVIIGTGPSLDRVDDSYFERFDTRVHVNFAASRIERVEGSYFFTTDAGPLIEYAQEYGVATFKQLGPDRCIIAPIFFDQYREFTPLGRALFTWLRADATVLKFETRKIGQLRIPYTVRVYPHQPDLATYRLQRTPAPSLPIFAGSSTLSAILFAALNGAASINLIGSGFVSGRAGSAGSIQGDAMAEEYGEAAATYRQLEEVLSRSGIELRNDSWEI